MEPLFWFAVSALAEPRAWAIIAALVPGVYVLLRVFGPENLFGQNRPAFKGFAFSLALSLFLVLIIVQGAKLYIPSERPCLPCSQGEPCNPYCPEDNSFPSGHAAVAFSVFTLPFFLNRKRNYLVFLVLAFLVSFSRLALGVHALQDILAGALIGLFCAFLGFYLVKKIPGF